MIHVNSIASWFKKNNEYYTCFPKEDGKRMICNLTLMATLFFYYKGIDVGHTEIKNHDGFFDIGITNYDEDYKFTEEEEFLLKVVNKEFGYHMDIYGYIIAEPLTFDNLYEQRKEYISDFLKRYNKADFDKHHYRDFETYTYINKKKMVFFIDNEIELTDELKDRMESFEIGFEEQYTYSVINLNGEIMIY
ncbi:MAG: hypothetical protein IJ193_06255 [Bacilli bacterium]|nr:hypothetical protein [Bacilli bacterium]